MKRRSTCPICGGNTKVLDSRVLTENGPQEARWRRRRCYECQAVWSTYEISEDEYRRLRALDRIIALMGRVLKRAEDMT